MDRDMTRQDWLAYEDSKPGNTPAARQKTAEILAAVQAAAEGRAAAAWGHLGLPDDDKRLPRYSCPDCQDIGWIVWPCGGRGGKCSVCPVYPDHRVAKACLTCELGIAREAGYWFRVLYHRDRRGNPVIVADHVKRFERAMSRLGPVSQRVQLALDAIVEREQSKGKSTPPTPQETRS